MSLDEIYSLIPHRPPFLWVDTIVSYSGDAIETAKFIADDLELFQGHYPDAPIMPGVILCEAIFQSGALLMAKRISELPDRAAGQPVLTRILGAKFKRPVFPGNTMQMFVNIKEEIAGVAFLKGTLKVNGKTAVQVEFACTLVALAEIDE